MRTLGEMAIIARHSDKKGRSILAYRVNTVMFVGNSNIHEKDVYQFIIVATKKTMLSRIVIWLNKIYSQHKEIPQVDFITSEVEYENMEVYGLEGEAHVGSPPAIPEDDNIEQLMGVHHVLQL
jgi:hypothetical protein